jgi:hypothetical protein
VDAVSKKDDLLKLCKDFIRSQLITCPETIYQSDRVIENAYEFIESVCEIVGYCKDEEP